MNKNSAVLDTSVVAFAPTDRGESNTSSQNGKQTDTYNSVIGDTVQLRVPSSHRYISVVRETVDAVSEQLNLSADDRMAVKLAVGEACNNAVDHALPSGAVPPHLMTVCVSVQPDALEIEVTNHGNGWHPQNGVAMPDPLGFAESGRGMPLMEMLMDSVEYLSGNGNTTVRMRKRLTQLA
jgi:serine/threonine-protein kinase RsbW